MKAFKTKIKSIGYSKEDTRSICCVRGRMTKQTWVERINNNFIVQTASRVNLKKVTKENEPKIDITYNGSYRFLTQAFSEETFMSMIVGFMSMIVGFMLETNISTIKINKDNTISTYLEKDINLKPNQHE